MSRQLLSLFIAQRGQGLSQREIAEVCSLVVAVDIGSPVLVQLKARNARARGIVAVRRDDGKYDINPPVACGRGRATTGFMTGVDERHVAQGGACPRCFKLRVTSQESRVQSYELRATRYESRLHARARVTSPKAAITGTSTASSFAYCSNASYSFVYDPVEYVYADPASLQLGQARSE